MKTYNWVEINRTNLNIKNITLKDATIIQYPHGLVQVTGLQSVCIDSKWEDEFPLKEKIIQLSTYNPLRLLGIKTRKIMVPSIPKDYSVDLVFPVFLEGVKVKYIKNEYQKRAYRVSPVWLETSK